MTDIAVFDPQSLQKKVSERVKAVFADLIPDAAFDEMVKREISGFFEVPSVKVESKETPHGYSGNDRRYDTGVSENITPFAQMVRECFVADLRKRLTVILLSPEWRSYPEVGSLVTQVTKELVPEIVTRLFQGIVGEAVQNIRQQMQR